MEYTRCLGACLVIGIAFLATSHAQHSVVRVGREVEPSPSTANIGGVIFLLTEGRLPTGVLFAFEAYFVNKGAVRFQVWRPVPPPTGSSNNNLTNQYFWLVGEIRSEPTIEDIETIYIASRVTESCIITQPGDRLAVYEEGDRGSVGYTFSSRYSKVLQHRLTNVSAPAQVGDTIQFGTLTFPYIFSVAAYVDTDFSTYIIENDSDFVQCPQNLDTSMLAPAPTLAPPTGAPGATGPQGPPGPAGPDGPRGVEGAKGPVGPVGPFGPAGDIGAPGIAGPVGATGATGPMGSLGSTGPRGDKGVKGVRGPPGPSAKVGAVVNEGDFFSSSTTVLILLIWLAIVTILLILILILIVVMRKRRAQQDAKDAERARHQSSFKSPPYDGPDGHGGVVGPDGVHMTMDTSREWMGTMKEDSEAGYSNDTIVVDGKRRSRRHYMNNNTSTPEPSKNNAPAESSEAPEMTSTLRTQGYFPQPPPDITASSQPPPASPIGPSPTSPTTPGVGGKDYPFENAISSTTDTITRVYDNEGNLSRDNLHMIGD